MRYDFLFYQVGWPDSHDKPDNLNKIHDSKFNVSVAFRSKSSLDEREKVITLTKPGLALKNKTSHIFKNMECRIKLTKTEQEQITTICNKILSRLGVDMW